MKRRDFILTILGKCCGRREFGRTSLQKACFFSSEVLDFDLGHRSHYYGPFSDEVERLTGALVLSGLVEEKSHTLGFVDESGYEGKRYEYSVTTDGRARIEAIRGAYSDDVSRIENFIDAYIEAAGSLDQRILSIAAKVFFIAKRECRWLEYEEIKEMAARLGWTLDISQISRIVQRLADLGFLRIKANSN